MKKVKIWFSGSEDSKGLASHRLVRILSKYYNVEITPDCEYLFIGYKDYVYDRKFLDKDCVRIFFSTENIFPDYNIIDYAICPNYSPLGDRFLWLPFYWWDDDSWNLLKSVRPTDWRDRKKFCCFIVSNNNAEPSMLDPSKSNRQLFFEELGKYQKVDSPGRYKNNVPPIEVDPSSGKSFYAAKIEFMRQYRFALTFENSSSPGYTTEKMVHAMVAGCIPIYWGDPMIDEQFNESSFIWLKNEQSLEKTIERIKKVDKGADQYEPFFAQWPPYKKKFEEICANDYVGKFLVDIIERGSVVARRRSRYYLNDRYEANLKIGFNGIMDAGLVSKAIEIPPEQMLPHTPNVIVEFADGTYVVTVVGDWKAYIQTFGGRFKLPAPRTARPIMTIPENTVKISFSCDFESNVPVIITPYVMQYDEEKDLRSDFRDSVPTLTGTVSVDGRRVGGSTNFKVAIRLTRQDKKNETFTVRLSKMEIVLKNIGADNIT